MYLNTIIILEWVWESWAQELYGMATCNCIYRPKYGYGAHPYIRLVWWNSPASLSIINLSMHFNGKYNLCIIIIYCQAETPTKRDILQMAQVTFKKLVSTVLVSTVPNLWDSSVFLGKTILLCLILSISQTGAHVQSCKVYCPYPDGTCGQNSTVEILIMHKIS